jgi:hypothetical protein
VLWIRIRIKKPGSRSASNKKPNPDPHQGDNSNPDPDQRDADPQHYLEETSEPKRFNFTFSKILLDENMYNNSGHGHGLRIRQKKTLGLPPCPNVSDLFTLYNADTKLIITIV